MLVLNLPFSLRSNLRDDEALVADALGGGGQGRAGLMVASDPANAMLSGRISFSPSLPSTEAMLSLQVQMARLDCRNGHGTWD